MKDAIKIIEEQQKKVKERSAPWMVGEQLKDICRDEPRSAKLLARDLQVEKMSIVEAEKKIKAFADSHKTGSFACVTPAEADRILRKFYGLPAAGEAGRPGVRPVQSSGPERAGTRMNLNLEDLLS